MRCRGDGCARAVWHRNMCSVFSVPALARVQGVTDIARARPAEQRFQRQLRPELINVKFQCVTAFRGSKFGYSMFVQNIDTNSDGTRTGEQFEVCTRPHMRACVCARVHCEDDCCRQGEPPFVVF